MRGISDETKSLLTQLFAEVSTAEKRTGLFRRQGNLENVLRLLKKLSDHGDWRVSPYLLGLVGSDRKEMRLAAAESLTELLSNATARTLTALDAQMRDMAPYLGRAWAEGVVIPHPDFKPQEVRSLDLPSAIAPSVFGLMSFLRSGYVREAALRRLTSLRSEAEVPFLLIRANDWVPQIRNLAYSTLRDRLEVEYAQAFSTHLSLVTRLQEAKRTDHADLVHDIEELILSSPGAMEQGFSSPYPLTRRATLNLALRKPDDRIRPLILGLLTDSDAVLRSVAARFVCEMAEEKTLRTYLVSILEDPSPRIRSQGLCAVAERVPNEARALKAALLDHSAAVRSTAVFYARRVFPDLDVAETYRDQLASATGKGLAAAVSGLGEFGASSDCERLLTFLNDAQWVCVRKAVLHALARLDAGSYAGKFLEALSSPLPGISRAAAEALACLPVEENTLSELLATPQVEHVRFNAFKVLSRLSKWARVYWFLRGASDPSERVSHFALQHLERWLNTYNRSFVSPSSAELDRIDAELSKESGEIPEGISNRVRFLSAELRQQVK